MLSKVLAFLSTGGVYHMPAGNLIQSPYFATGNPETEEYTALPATGSTLPPAGSLGMVADFDQGGSAGPRNLCRYQFVKCGAGITPVVGNVMYWLDRTALTVTTVRTTRGSVAGICRIAAAAAAEYIWVLKKGRRGVKFVASPTSTCDTSGKPVVPSDATDGVADCLANSETQAADPIIGRCLSTTTSTIATVDVMIPDMY